MGVNGSCGGSPSIATDPADDKAGGMADEAVERAVRALELANADGEAMTFKSLSPLDKGRLEVMATAFPECGGGDKVVGITATRGDETKEFVAVVKDDKATLVTGTCQITYEDLTPSDCIEYAFAEAPDAWAMAQLSREALENYRGMKFEAWKGMLVSPSCEAAFRRMLQLGMVGQLYDPHVFPTPESMKSKYQVTDERTGKLIELPHPVKALRVWDAAAGKYEVIDVQLTGAPGDSDAKAWWASFIEELGTKHGAEYIASLLEGK